MENYFSSVNISPCHVDGSPVRCPKYIRLAALLALSVFSAGIIAAGEGTLTVSTQPQSVQVWLDDKYIGDSPLKNKKLAEGRYTLRLVDPLQLVSVSEVVLIRPGDTTVVEKSLSRRFGTLIVKTEPPGAQVALSTPLGKTPLANNFMRPGKYRVEMRHPQSRYEPAVEEVTIPEGRKVELSNTLEKRNPFGPKALIRAGLGLGAVAGFVWAIAEQGNHKVFEAQAESRSPDNSEQVKKADRAASRRTVGIILGSACVLGFEVVAFF